MADNVKDYLARFEKGKIEVADCDDDIIGADYVVCILAEQKVPFDDNVFDFCYKCDAKVQLRPHVPPGPKRICYSCALKLHGPGDEVVNMISPKTYKDIAEWLLNRKKR